MLFSVLIPAYNAAATLPETLDAVLAQTVEPHEILVFDDGSTDATAEVLAAYAPRVRAFSRPNGGVARARNFLCAQATGDRVAFLDADDIWHPRYLEVQTLLAQRHPAAVATFTGHVDVLGHAGHPWQDGPGPAAVASEQIEPCAFIKRVNHTPMEFGMSWFCMRTDALARLGDEPFSTEGLEDAYIHNVLPLLGPVARTPEPLVAYRILDGSLSSDRLWSAARAVETFRLLAPRYSDAAPELSRTFRSAVASRKRDCGKFLMGAGRVRDARAQFRESLRDTAQLGSVVKSLALLLLTLAPRSLQHGWPGGDRV